MPRIRKKFKRESFVREAQQLFVIASEGTETEPRYFEEFKSPHWYKNRSIYIETLRRIDSDSSPSRILKQLREFKKDYNLKDTDELWMVIDRDKRSWTISEIDNVAQQCLQNRFGFALSNPCIEFWLLLHKRDISEYNESELKELFENKRKRKGLRTRLERELVNVCGSYSKSKLNAEDYLPYVGHAIERAKRLVKHKNERWPNYLGTHVFKLMEKLMPK